MRQVTPTDAPGLARLINEVWDHNLNPERIASVGLDSNRVTVVADSGSDVIGFADGFMTATSDGVPRWEVDLLAVDARYRGRGIAQRLIAASVDAGRLAGAAVARALVQIGNAPSLRAFQRCGFTPEAATCELTVSGAACDERLTAPLGAHLISVRTYTYSGIWIEGRLSLEALRCARSIRTRYAWDVAGAVIPEGTFDQTPEGYAVVGRYRWLHLSL